MKLAPAPVRPLLAAFPALALALVGGAGCYNFPKGDPFDPGDEPITTKPSISAAIAAVANSHELLGGLSLIFGEPPSYYAALMVAENSTPDQRFVGISYLSERGFGKGEPYTDAYATLARTGSADLVRAMSIRALNHSADEGRTALLVEALGDESPMVRLEAAKALGNLPDPEAAAPLLQVASSADEDLDVRLAAVDALRHYPQNGEVIDRLIALLDGDVFDLVFQSRASLAVLFGRDLGYTADAWRSAAPRGTTTEPAA